MRTEQEIREKLENQIKLLERPENQNEEKEIQLYAYIDILNWVLRG